MDTRITSAFRPIVNRPHAAAAACNLADARPCLLPGYFVDSTPSLAPVLRPVPDVQDFDNFVGGTVHNDIGRADEFAGSFHLSGSAKAGEGCQLFNAVDNRLSNTPGCDWIVLLDAF